MLSPRGCHAQCAALRPALSGPRESVPTVTRIPTTRRRGPPRHTRRRPPLSKAAPLSTLDRVCPMRHTTDTDRPVLSPPRWSPHVPAPSSMSRRLDAAVTDFAGKQWCRCLHHAAVSYAHRHLYRELTSRHRPYVGEAPSCPSLHRLLCAGDIAAVRTASCALVPHRARAHAVPSWARPRSSWARLGRTRAAQAGCTDNVPLGRRRIRPSGI
jgi:hypothetical protein